jgi:hypothetical protein
MELDPQLVQELDSELAPELLLLETKALAQELKLELDSVLQELTRILKELE